MRARLHSGKAVDEVDLDRLRELYAALGPGFPAAALAVFAGDDPSEGGDWCVSYRGRTQRCLRASEFSNDELFILPPRWEVMRVVVRTLRGKLTKRGDVVSVTGYFYCRPRGSWTNERIPFLHLWTMCAGQALSFESFLDNIELRRVGRVGACLVA
jgi:hypothetical protein